MSTEIELRDIFSRMESIDESNSCYNLCEATAKLGFKKEWNLGGDDGHGDFIQWLYKYFQYKYPVEYQIIMLYAKQASDDPTKAYNPYVYFALDKYYKAGQPEMYGMMFFEDEEDYTLQNCSKEMQEYMRVRV